MVKKIEMPVGQKVRGYGLLNEFGEFEFIPEQKGIRMGETKLIKQSEDFTLSETKNLIVVHLRMQKQSGLSLLKNYLQISNEILLTLKNYEF